jgi:Cytochrome P460
LRKRVTIQEECVVAGRADVRDDGRVRPRVAALAVALAVACAGAVVTLAAPAKNGLPSYTNGYAGWTKLNRKPFSTPGAHNGVKNVYASKTRAANRTFPDGAVIVKSIAEPGAKGLPAQVAVMRKVRGRWQWIEYTLTGSRYGVLARGQLCVDCHMQVRSNDWVFTKR